MGIYGIQPPPPSTEPPKVPIQQPIRRSLWAKITQPEKPPTTVKTLSLLNSSSKPEKPKEDVLEDKTLPDPVRRFIVRGFAKCYTESEKAHMRAVLRPIIGRAKTTGEIYTKKWDELDLPKLPREIHGSMTSLLSSINPPLSTIPVPSNPIPTPQTKSIVSVPKATPEELKKRSKRKSRFATVTHSEPRTFLSPFTRTHN